MSNILVQLLALSKRLMNRLPLPNFSVERRPAFTTLQAMPITTLVADTDRLHLLDGKDPDNYIALDSEDSAAGALATQIGRLVPHLRDVRLELRGDMVLQRRLALPKASRAVLRRVLAYELPRLVPLKPEHLYFDHVSDTSTLVRLRIVRRDRLDGIIRICHAAQVRVAEIFCGDDPVSVSRTTFPVDRDALARLIWRRYRTATLACFLSFLTILTLATFYFRGVERQDLVNKRLLAAGHHAMVAAHLQAEITALDKQALFLTTQKKAPLVIATLTELSRVLPNGTWLNEVQLNGLRVRIRGDSTNASDLIARIDSSGRFKRAYFGAPIVHAELGGDEQFDLSFELKPA